MPARATPSSLKAIPAETADSVNPPFVLLTYSLFGCVSLAITRSGQPSPFTSSTATPSDFDELSNNPAFAVASSNLPLPRLCHRRTDAPLYDSGVQYDLWVPSSCLLYTSDAADEED